MFGIELTQSSIAVGSIITLNILTAFLIAAVLYLLLPNSVFSGAFKFMFYAGIVLVIPLIFAILGPLLKVHAQHMQLIQIALCLAIFWFFVMRWNHR